jgi:hypothetical protein
MEATMVMKAPVVLGDYRRVASKIQAAKSSAARAEELSAAQLRFSSLGFCGSALVGDVSSLSRSCKNSAIRQIAGRSGNATIRAALAGG